MGYDSDRHATRGMIGRCEVNRVYDADGEQLVDITGLSEQTFRGLMRMQPFGESSNPPPGSDGLMLFLGGRPNQGVVIVCDSPDTRPRDLPVGCKAIYNMYGDIISLLQHKIRVVTTLVEVVAGSVDLQVTNLVVEGPGGGAHANVILDIPTADPHVAGRLWSNAGTVKVSAG